MMTTAVGIARRTGMSNAPREVYFVGTIPLTRPFDVFTTIADRLGARVARIPDGEIGDRKMWVQGQYPALAACPALEVAELPAEGLTRQTSYQIPVRLRPGAGSGDIAFGPLGYARYAISSFGIFRALKRAGRIDRHTRFQVNLPAPMEVMVMVTPSSRIAVERAYERAMLAELARIQEVIPNEELAVTWDIVQGVLLWEAPDNNYVDLWFDNPLEGVAERFVRLGEAVRPEVELGYHLCYGSQDHRHAIEPADLRACVELTNAIARGLSRRIDYVHMPVPRERRDTPYFAPLGALDGAKVGKVFLGLLHYTDGVAGACERIEAARGVLPEFGIATECGFGRRPSHQDVMRLIQLHADVTC
jgi:hypothetical protein